MTLNLESQLSQNAETRALNIYHLIYCLIYPLRPQMQIPKLLQKPPHISTVILVIEEAGPREDRGPTLNLKQQEMGELAFKGRYMVRTSPGSVALGT